MGAFFFKMKNGLWLLLPQLPGLRGRQHSRIGVGAHQCQPPGQRRQQRPLGRLCRLLVSSGAGALTVGSLLQSNYGGSARNMRTCRPCCVVDMGRGTHVKKTLLCTDEDVCSAAGRTATGITLQSPGRSALAGRACTLMAAHNRPSG